MKSIVVLGDGAWGTALALVLQRGGHRVGLWSKFPEHAAEIRAKGENAKFLPGTPLKGVDILSGAPPAADVYVAAVPTQFIRGTFSELGPSLATVHVDPRADRRFAQPEPRLRARRARDGP